MRSIIIGFGHKRLRGKDTSANFIVDYMNMRIANDVLDVTRFRRDFFAFSLKEGIGKHVFGLSEEQLHDQLSKKQIDDFWGMTPRDILQRSGTDAMRNVFGQDIWVNTLRRRMLNQPDTSVVVSDVRFINEADAIKSWGGYLFRIDRDIPFEDGVDDHASEVSLDSYTNWDFVIDNNGTISDLHTKIADALNTILRVYT